MRLSIVLPAAMLLAAGGASAQPVIVRDVDGLRRAAAGAKPGARILLAPGEYPGGFSLDGLRGAPGKPIVIAAADPKSPPVIAGGGSGMQLTDPVHLELRDLVFRGQRGNGLNIDDGGSYDTPARHLLLSGLQVSDIGPQGNHDGIKLSGVDDFRIEGCRIERWGTRGGSAIDMVGCHRGVIEGNTFIHEGAEGASGVQAKGGSSGIAIRANRFQDAGGRAVNIGGSTGFQYFRPPLGDGERFEARDITVEGNTFIGGAAPVAFVGVDGAVVRFNTIYRPRRWAMRILQETTDPSFLKCQNGRFTDNIIAFRADELREAANVGGGTSPETFTFARNVWYALDRPERSRVRLPTEEEGALVGRDPLFVDAEASRLELRPESPARKAGAAALPKAPKSSGR